MWMNKKHITIAIIIYYSDFMLKKALFLRVRTKILA